MSAGPPSPAPRTRARPGDPRQGVILVAVLWSVALMAALAMAASTTFRGFAGILSVETEKARLEGLLTAGLESAAHLAGRMGERPIRDYEAAVALPAGAVRLRLNDESGRIDLGKAPPELLAGLLRALGVRDEAGDLAKQWAAWREKPGNAAAADAAGFVRMLRLPPDAAAKLAPLATVYGRETVNPLAAPAAVLEAVPGLDSARLAVFLDLRARSPADAQRLLPALGPGRSHLDVKPRQAVSVDLAVRMRRGLAGAARAVIVLLNGDSQPYRVLVWDPAAPDYPR